MRSRILRAAEGADLLIAGTRGHSPLKRLALGSVATQLAHHAPCPLVSCRRTGRQVRLRQAGRREGVTRRCATRPGGAARRGPWRLGGIMVVVNEQFRARPRYQQAGLRQSPGRHARVHSRRLASAWNADRVQSSCLTPPRRWPSPRPSSCSACWQARRRHALGSRPCCCSWPSVWPPAATASAPSTSTTTNSPKASASWRWPFILFSGGLSTERAAIRPVVTYGVVLATFGVLVTAIVAGAAGRFRTGRSRGPSAKPATPSRPLTWTSSARSAGFEPTTF